MKRDLNLTTEFCVDELGAVKAAIADLNTKADGLKAIIICAAVTGDQRAFEGDLFRATVSFTTKTVTDKDAVIAELAEKLGMGDAALAALVRKNTQTAEGVPAVRVTSRKGV